jgi:hypothetical protein
VTLPVPLYLFIFILFYSVFCVCRSEHDEAEQGKLRKFAQSGEVVAAPVSLKRKKVDEGPSKQVRSHLLVHRSVMPSLL